MTQVTPDLKAYLESGQLERLIAAAGNPRDKAFIALLARTGIRISEAIKVETTNIDFQGRTLTIVRLKEKARLKCPHCGESLGKRHVFCPGCGNRVDQAVREKIEQRRQLTISSYLVFLLSLSMSSSLNLQEIDKENRRK